jgi:hypothetical protein
MRCKSDRHGQEDQHADAQRRHSAAAVAPERER